jgi:hypothetical protein
MTGPRRVTYVVEMRNIDTNITADYKKFIGLEDNASHVVYEGLFGKQYTQNKSKTWKRSQ